MTVVAGSRLIEHREGILQRWKERWDPSARARTEAAALEREVTLLLDTLANGLAVGAPHPDRTRDLGARLAGRDSMLDGLLGIELLQEVVLELLEAEGALSSPARSALFEGFRAIRLGFAEAMQERQRQLEQAVVRSEERYLVAARAAGFAIWDWALEEGKLHWSHSVETIFGHPVDALSSLGLWLEYIHPAERDRVGEGLRRAIEEGTARWTDTFQLLRRDGTWAAVLGRAWVLHDQAGEPVRVVGGLIDVTEQSRLEMELKRSEEGLREAVRVRDDFLSIASHELRTPLTALQMQIQSMTMGPLAASVDERLERRLRGAERSVERMVQLVDELLDVSRLNAGRLTLVCEQVDLAQVVREVVARMQPEVQRSGSSLTLALLEAVGRWDQGRLDQVVSNLLSNALKYGQGAPIEVGVEAAGDRVLLRVKDHGIGIPSEHHARIFERFERAVSGRHFGGLGLGLWIVRRILDAMNASVRVESEPGKGATFEVSLPRGGGE